MQGIRIEYWEDSEKIAEMDSSHVPRVGENVQLGDLFVVESVCWVPLSPLVQIGLVLSS